MQDAGPESAVPVSEYLEAEPQRWPLVLGILSLLWGGVGAVSGILGVVSMFRERTGGASGITTGPAAVSLGLLGALLALALVFGGVQLLRRRAMAIGLLKAWVVLSVLAQVASTAFIVGNRDAFEESLRDKMEASMDEQAARSGGKATPLPAGMAGIMLMSGMVCGGAMSLGAAGVMAFFVFGRRGREAESAWSGAAA